MSGLTHPERHLAGLKAIPGLGGHVLVGPAGEILSHDAPNPEALGALVALSRALCPTLERELASSAMQHLVFHRGFSERFFILPLEQHTLGFFQKKEALGSELVGRVMAWKDSLEA